MKYLKYVIIAALVISCVGISYTEISEHSIVSGVAVDLNDDVWTVTCEIIMPSSSNDFASSSAYIEGKGHTLYNALEDAALKSPRIMFTDTVSVYLINQNAYEDNSVFQYFCNGNVNLRALAVCTEGNASDVFRSEDEYTKSTLIADKIKNYCKDQDVPTPYITEYLKKGECITYTSQKTPERSVSEFE